MMQCKAHGKSRTCLFSESKILHLVDVQFALQSPIDYTAPFAFVAYLAHPTSLTVISGPLMDLFSLSGHLTFSSSTGSDDFYGQ